MIQKIIWIVRKWFITNFWGNINIKVFLPVCSTYFWSQSSYIPDFYYMIFYNYVVIIVVLKFCVYVLVNNTINISPNYIFQIKIKCKSVETNCSKRLLIKLNFTFLLLHLITWNLLQNKQLTCHCVTQRSQFPIWLFPIYFVCECIFITTNSCNKPWVWYK